MSELYQAHNGKHPTVLSQDGGREIAVVTLSGYRVGTDKSPKDYANLFAAAPDLLEALQNLMWRFEDDDEDPNSRTDVAPDIAAARAAIAKATS